MRTHQGIWPGASEVHPPALGSKNAGHLGLIHQIVSHVFA